MKIETYIIEVACGGLCQFLGRNEITPFMLVEVYNLLNDMVIQRIGTMNMEELLNGETPDTWKVVFLQAETSYSRHKYLFVRVEGK